MMLQGLVVDDHPIVREGLKSLLEKAFPSMAVMTSSGSKHIAD
jgi:DNA-binding NarL/FixJ family response regulator